jgi:hypothetical protein
VICVNKLLVSVSRLVSAIGYLVPLVPSSSHKQYKAICLARGGNGSDADRIVLFPHPFFYFQKEYGCEYGYCRMRMRSGWYSNTNTT